MANNEHSIRVSARGEFGQLSNGLKNLQKDLKSVLGEIDKGARRGGLFDETQLRALDIYKTRFKATMDEVEKEMKKQNDTIDQLERRKANSSRDSQKAIDDEIRRREKLLDSMRREMRMVEDLYQKRAKEAEAYKTESGSSSSPSSSYGGGGGGSSFFGGALSKAMGMGKFMVGLAGIGGIASMAQQAYQLAYQSQVMPMNLSQRLRGHGFTGSAKNMWDEIGQTGRNNSMGYTSQESWQFMDAYSRRAGGMSAQGLEGSLMFGRAYGLEVGETAGGLSENRALGGASSAQAFANMISASVSKSGMTPRILEVLETSNGLLEQMNTSLKDGGSKQILAYQTTLDKIGNDKGMMRLTGQQGANVISGMGGIFNPGQDNSWKWMGIQALQQYNPKKYGGMGLYDLETNFESGLENTDNVAAMASYLRGKSGGDENTMKRMLQRWLQDGGYNATKQQVNDLYSATDGFTAFDSDKMNGVMGGLDKGDATSKYQERMGQLGQDILDTDARFEKQLENLGQPLLTIVQGVKEGITSILEELQNEGIAGILADIKKFLDDHLKETILAGAIAAALAGSNLLGGGGGGKGKSHKSSKSSKSSKGGGGLAVLGGGLLGSPLALAAGIFAGTYFGGKMVQSDGFAKFMNKMFPAPPRSKEAEKAFQKAADPKNKHMAWYEYANLSKWGDINWKELFNFNTDTSPAKELATKKFGYKDPDKAIEALAKLGDTGQININGLTETGKKALQNLADQGVIKISEGQTMSVTTLSGFSEAGKAKLQEMAQNGQISLSGFSENGTAKITALTEEGKTNLLKLKDGGLIDIGKFKEETTVQITDLSKTGAKKLLQLEQNGSLSLNSMDSTTEKKLESVKKETKTKLGEIKEEHVSFKEKAVGKDGIFQKWADDFGTLWDKFIESIKDLLPSWLGGGDSNVGGNGGVGKNYDIRTQSGVSAKQLDARLGGVLDGHGDDFIAAGKKYGIDPAVLAAISMHETGNGTSSAVRNKNNVGGLMGSGGLMSFGSLAEGIEAFAKNLKKNYIDKGLYTIEQIQKKYAPVGASNDPTGLNNNWIKGVTSYLGGFGVAASAGDSSIGNNYFNNWQSRVTSRFGSKESFRSTGHGGLDIDGNQGDAVQALKSGTIAFLSYDDGSSRDADGKANTRAGGTELGVKMADGKTYFYSHLSNVASGLKVGDSLSAGQYVGNVGGDPGRPGSGYSTTGSHLHLGLLNAAGSKIDPESWLKSLSAGDSDVGNYVESGTTVKDVNVTVTLQGEVDKLNGQTETVLRSLIQKVMQEYETQKILLNPSIG